MAEIHRLTRCHLPIGRTEKDVLCLLESLIEKAERGELLGLACGWVEGNNSVHVQIADGSANAALLASAVGALDFEIQYRWSGRK